LLNIKYKHKESYLLIAGTVVAQLIAIGFQPILKEIYPVQFFGYFEIYMRVAAVLSIIMTLKLEYIIYSIHNEKNRRGFLSSLLLFVVLNFLLILLFFYLYDRFDLPMDKVYDNLIFFAVFSALCMSIFKVTYFFLSKHGQHLDIVKSRIIKRSTEGFVQTGFGFTSFMSYGLYIGEMLGNILFFSYAIKRSKVKALISTIDLKKFVLKLKSNRDLPLKKATSDIVTMFADAVVIIALATKFGILSVGYVELAFKVLVLPAALISSAMNPLILQRVSDAFLSRNSLIMHSIKDIFMIVIGSAIIFFIAMLLFGEKVFFMVFSYDWIKSYEYIMLLIYPTLFQFIVSPFGEVLTLIKKIQIDAIWKIVKLIALSLLFLIDFETAYDLLFTYSIILTSLYFLYGIIIFKYIYQEDRNSNLPTAL
jgi:O-antigen/teichoic acid export membrane protein